MQERQPVTYTAMAGVACLIALLLCVSGCAQPDRKPKRAPQWVKQPASTGEGRDYVYAVGASEPDGSEPPDEAQARIRARAQLSHAVRTYVQDVLKSFVKSADGLGDPSDPAWQDFTRLVAAEVSASVLRRDMGYEAWRDPAAGTLYVLCKVSVEDVHALIRREAGSMLNEVNPFGKNQKQGLTQLAGFLQEELKKRPSQPKAEEVPEKSPQPEPKGDSPPGWLTGGDHPDYPSQEYLTAVGLGETPEGAEDEAHEEMAATLDSAIATQFRKVKKAKSPETLSRNLSALQSETIAFEEVDLVHSRVVETWHDPVTGTRYALAILERTKAASAFRNRAQTAMSKAVEVLGSGANHRMAGNYRDALDSYLAGVEYGQRAVKYQLAGAAVQPSKSEEWKKIFDQPVVADARTAIQEVLKNVRFVTVSGDHQWTAPGMGLDEALTVRLTGGYDGKPLRNWPVSFQFVRGKGQLESQGKTDAEGVASCRVDEINSSPGPTVAVRAELNLVAMAGEADVAGIEVPGTEFVCVLRSKSNSFFALYVDEAMPGDEPAVNPVIADRLTEDLKAGGFNLLESDKVLKRVRAYGLSGDSEVGGVLEAFAPLQDEVQGEGFLLVAVVDADAKVVESVNTSQGTLHIVHAPAEVRVIDPLVGGEEASTVISFKTTGKGAHTEKVSQAARMARERLARSVAEKLIVRLEDRFGGN